MIDKIIVEPIANGVLVQVYGRSYPTFAFDTMDEALEFVRAQFAESK